VRSRRIGNGVACVNPGIYRGRESVSSGGVRVRRPPQNPSHLTTRAPRSRPTMCGAQQQLKARGDAGACVPAGLRSAAGSGGRHRPPLLERQRQQADSGRPRGRHQRSRRRRGFRRGRCRRGCRCAAPGPAGHLADHRRRRR
jgi:hypothetical protein